MSYLLGIDIGTSATKSVLFNKDGKTIASASYEYPLYQPHPGWAEQDPADWWDAVCFTCKKILNDSSVGNRHNARCKAGFLLGGYIAGGFFSKEYALNEIQPIVLQNTDLQIDKAMKTIHDVIEEGMSEPITFEHLEKNRENYLGQKNGFSEIPKKDFTEVQSINKVTGELIINQIPHCFWFEIKCF